jgi:uncharacterized protein YacL
MHYRYITAQCSKCKRVLYMKITEIMGAIRVNSGLGPNTVICSSCNNTMTTENREWQQMSTPSRIWYCILSIVYGLIIGFMTTIPIKIADEALFKRNLPAELVIGFIVVIVLLIQLFRIQLSNRRMKENQESSKVISFWTWETNLQFFGMMWIILCLLAIIPLLMSY